LRARSQILVHHGPAAVVVRGAPNAVSDELARYRAAPRGDYILT
jgi:hypothetical protein